MRGILAGGGGGEGEARGRVPRAAVSKRKTARRFFPTGLIRLPRPFPLFLIRGDTPLLASSRARAKG